MPGIQWAVFGTLHCLQQSDQYLLELMWNPSWIPHHQAPHNTQPTAWAPTSTQDTRESPHTHPMPEPAHHPPCLQDPAASTRVPHVCRPRLRLHDLHHHNYTPPPPPRSLQPPNPLPAKRGGGTSQQSLHLQPSRGPNPPPCCNAKSSHHANPPYHHGPNLPPRPGPSPRLAPRQQPRPRPPHTSSTTSSPCHQGLANSSARLDAPRPSRTPLPPSLWRNAPRQRRNTPHPITTRTRPPGPQAIPPARARATPRATSGVCIPIPAPGCAHVQRIPHYRRRHRPQPNPEAESVSTCPRVRARLRPANSPRTPKAQDYKYFPGPTAAASLCYSTACTQARAHPQGHGPAHGPWWQRWTRTQLWELRKCARAENSLEGLVHRPSREVTENRRLHPVGGSMSQDAWEAMLADALHPQAVHPRQLLAPHEHPHFLRRLRETLQATRKIGKRVWEITQAQPNTQIPLATSQRSDPQNPGNPARHTG